MPSAGASARRSSIAVRTIIATLAGLACLALGAIVFLPEVDAPDAAATSRTPSSFGPTALPSMATAADDGYLVSADELRDIAEMARAGLDPHRSAVDALLLEADRALDRQPRPVNPLSPRRDRFLDDTQDAYTLALAWIVSNDGRYAQRSAQFIMAWVEQVDETRDTCPDRGGADCLTSLLVSRNAPAFVFAARLLEGSGALSDDDEQRLKRWLADLILPAASERANNWGDAGTFMRIAVADYVGDATAFAAAVGDWRRLIDLVTADGQIPEESRRGSLGLLYTQGAISYKVGAAVIAERRGIDLWNYEGAAGGTLRAAINTLAHYWVHPEDWPWHDGRLEVPSVDPAWEMIYDRWPEPIYARIFAPMRPLGTANPSAIIWTTLSHGAPITGPTSSNGSS